MLKISILVLSLALGFIAYWDYNIKQLKTSKHLDILNFEVSRVIIPERPEPNLYGELTLEKYFT